MPSAGKKFRPGWLLTAGVVAGLASLAANRPLFTFLNGVKWPPLDWFMLSLTELGNGAVAAMLVLLLSPFRRDLTLRAAAAMIVAGVLCALVKDSLSLPRPPALLGEAVRVLGPKMMGRSFPSGHTATVFALACALKGSVPRRVYLAALLGAVLVGVSRVYIGAHFPVDAASGALLGWGSASAARRPADSLARYLDGPRPVVDGFFLALAALCAVYIAFFEPMVRYNPWFMRPLGLAGLAASLFLLGRTIVRKGALN